MRTRDLQKTLQDVRGDVLPRVKLEALAEEFGMKGNKLAKSRAMLKRWVDAKLVRAIDNRRLK